MASTGNTDYYDALKALEERPFTAVRGLIDIKSQSSSIAKVRGLVLSLIHI